MCAVNSREVGRATKIYCRPSNVIACPKCWVGFSGVNVCLFVCCFYCCCFYFGPVFLALLQSLHWFGNVDFAPQIFEA